MRNQTIDISKTFMALMIIALHAEILQTINQDISFIFVNGIFRIAVPFFFLMSGYFFYSTLQSGRSKIWLLKLIKLYIIWSSVYLTISVQKYIDKGLPYLAKDLIIGYWHLWYLPATIISSLAIIALEKFRLNGLKISIGLFSLGCLIQYASALQIINNFPIWAYRNAVFFGLPFFYIGFMIAKKDITLQNKFWYKITFVTLIIEILIARFALKINSSMDMYFSLAAAGPFILLKILQSKNVVYLKKYPKQLPTFLYFSHPLFILATNKLDNLDGVFKFAIATILSTALYFAISKSKVAINNLT